MESAPNKKCADKKCANKKCADKKCADKKCDNKKDSKTVRCYSGNHRINYKYPVDAIPEEEMYKNKRDASDGFSRTCPCCRLYDKQRTERKKKAHEKQCKKKCVNKGKHKTRGCYCSKHHLYAPDDLGKYDVPESDFYKNGKDALGGFFDNCSYCRLGLNKKKVDKRNDIDKINEGLIKNGAKNIMCKCREHKNKPGYGDKMAPFKSFFNPKNPKKRLDWCSDCRDYVADGRLEKAKETRVRKEKAAEKGEFICFYCDNQFPETERALNGHGKLGASCLSCRIKFDDRRAQAKAKGEFICNRCNHQVPEKERGTNKRGKSSGSCISCKNRANDRKEQAEAEREFICSGCNKQFPKTDKILIKYGKLSTLCVSCVNRVNTRKEQAAEKGEFVCHDCRSQLPEAKRALNKYGKPTSSCLSCKNDFEIRNEEAKAKGEFICSRCRHQFPEKEQLLNEDGSLSKSCSSCKIREKEHHEMLKTCRREIKIERAMKAGASCELCGIIYLIDKNNMYHLIKLKTKYNREYDDYVVEYKGELFIASEFIEWKKHRLQLRILEWDHLPEDEARDRRFLLPNEEFVPKVGQVSEMSCEFTMRQEAEKCQLICMECHVKETIKREKGWEPTSLLHIQKLSIVNNLKKTGCKTCKYKNKDLPRFMHMDHKKPRKKDIGICEMVMDNYYTVDDLMKELEKCRVLCGHCHAIHTQWQFDNGIIRSGMRSEKVEYSINE